MIFNVLLSKQASNITILLELVKLEHENDVLSYSIILN